MKTLSHNVLLLLLAFSASITSAQQREPRVLVMPQLQIKGIAHGKSVVTFVVNGKVPLISSGGVATVNWVNGRSAHGLSRRGDLTLPSFDYVDYNLQLVRVKSNYIVLLAMDPKKEMPAHLSRQIDDPRCPHVPLEADLGYNPNEGCVADKLSPYMSDVLGFIPLERVLLDPAVKSNQPVVLEKGVDF